jgi:hypothetical protein
MSHFNGIETAISSAFKKKQQSYQHQTSKTNIMSLSYMPLALSTISASAPRQTTKEIPQKAENPSVKLVIGAGITLGFEFGIGQYLEFIKIMKQTKPGHSYLYLTREITQAKGVIGIWDGFFPWGAIQAVAKGAVFSWGHALAKQTLQPLVEKDSIGKGTAEVIAGGVGGGLQGFVLSPTLLLKTRVMTDPVFRQPMSPMETFSKSLSVGMRVITNEGLPALMKGSTVFSMKRIADWSTRFFFSVQSEEFLYKRQNPMYQLTTTEKMTASLMGGIFSTLCTLPIDVMVAHLQQASKAGAKVSVFKTFSEEFKKGGIKQVAGFATTGFIARVTHVALTTMIMKTATSVIYEAYEEKQHEKLDE